MSSKLKGRYRVPDDEGYEPGSDGVIRNYLGIQSREDIEALEEEELKRAELELIKLFDENHQFTAEDICNIHELWLGDIYPFAGKYRTVNMSKDDFLFATPSQIANMMKKLERDSLFKYTPCHNKDTKDLAYALGVVHVELILIHPFREGNGRTARLLADLMATQAGRDFLIYRAIDQTENKHGFDKYIQAIHAGFNENYELISEVFEEILLSKYAT